MQEFERTAEAYRDNELIASEVVIVERVEVRTTRVPLPGTGTVGRKDQHVRHPTLSLFRALDSDAFRADLERLAQASADPDIGRRDRQWRPAPLTLEFDDGTKLVDVFVDRPLSTAGAVEVLLFPVRHASW